MENFASLLFFCFVRAFQRHKHLVFFTVGVGILQFSPKNPKTPSRSTRVDDGTEYTIDVLLQVYVQTTKPPAL